MPNIEIISPARRVEKTTYSLDFEYLDRPGAGFSFPCDKHGTPKFAINAARDNYQKCINGEYNVGKPEIVEQHLRYIEPAVARCHCGGDVMLSDSWANDCESCDYEYDGNGALLAPRRFWGEETGEQF